MNEVWKDIEDYEGLYQVSNLGRVLSLERTIYMFNGEAYCYKTYKSRIRKLSVHKSNGSIQVQINLYNLNNQVKYCFVSRLVAKAFLPNSLNLPDVIHKDGDTTNNYDNNLKWGTMKKVMKRMIKNNQRGEPNRRLSDENVKTIRKLYKTKLLNNIEIAKIYDCSSANIGHIVRNETFINQF